MRLGAVGHVITHAGAQREATAVGEFGLELTFEAEQEVTLRAPVICAVSGGVLEQPHAHIAELTRAPVGFARDAGMRRALDRIPIYRAERQVGDVH